MSKNSYKVKKCRICGGKNLYEFLDLGSMPIPNGFVEGKYLNKKEEYFPLGTCVCLECKLVQLTEVVDNKVMFENYLYIPSTSQTMLDHFSELADDVVARFDVGESDLVIDVGSNDGTLLQYFKANETKILGIDPADNLVKVANLKGIESVSGFFDLDLARKIKRKYGQAKVITATNVLAHIDDLHSVIKGVKHLLTNDGVFIVEFPYIIDLLENVEFDTIYHEHLSYFGLMPLNRLFLEHELRTFDVRHIQNIHGGSLRIFVCYENASYKSTPRLARLLKSEAMYSKHIKKSVGIFAKRVKKVKKELLAFLKKMKKTNKRVVGYGAAAKGNVLLNYCDIGTDKLDYIVDSIPYKQGLYTPGTHIPIYPEKKLIIDKPNYAVILAWNFADEIFKKNRGFVLNRGKFILTHPDLKIM